jgi:hypothetical protein
MKIRQGFVSNSSSSSFICVIGKIIDEEKFNSFLQEQKEKQPDWKLVTEDDIYLGSELKNVIKNKICDFESCVYFPDNVNPEDKVFVYSCAGNEGDYCFSYETEDSGWSDYNYDIDLDFFSEEEQDLTNLTPETHGVQIVNVTYYAGRNG